MIFNVYIFVISKNMFAAKVQLFAKLLLSDKYIHPRSIVYGPYIIQCPFVDSLAKYTAKVFAGRWLNWNIGGVSTTEKYIQRICEPIERIISNLLLLNRRYANILPFTVRRPRRPNSHLHEQFLSINQSLFIYPRSLQVLLKNYKITLKYYN